MIVAIHQPNFFPWLGYFDKISRADRFIFLDDVQYPKKGGSWSNRVQLLVNGAARWVTAPVDRAFGGTRTIQEMRFDAQADWRDKLMKTLEVNYGRAPFFARTVDWLEPVIQNGCAGVSEYNIHAVTVIADAIGLDTSKLALASDLPSEGAATARLISLTRASGGEAYLVGGGAGGYQEDDVFAANGIGLMRQDFRHPDYPQNGARDGFVPGLSIIDALMNVGVVGVRDLLIGRR